MQCDRLQLARIFVLGGVMMAPPVFAGSTLPVYVPETAGRDNATALLVVNSDQLKGNWKQFKGELKKQWADITDDDLLYIEAHKDKLDGKIQERYGDRREEVKQWIDQWFERHDAQGRNRSK